MADPVAIPTMKGVQGAVADYGFGAGGGLIFGLSKAMLGSGFLGSLIAAAVAGSAIKGSRGETIATIAGFMAMADAFGGVGRAAPDNGGGGGPEVM